MVYFVISIIAYFIYDLWRYKDIQLVSRLPIVLVLFDAVVVLYDTNPLVTFSKGAILFLCLFKYKKYIFNNLNDNIYIIFFIAYCAVILPFSNYYIESTKNIIKMGLPLLYYYVGLSFSSKENIFIYIKKLIEVMILALVLGGIGYFFNVGDSFDYGRKLQIDLGSVGLLQGGNYYPIAICLVSVIGILPYSLKLKSKKSFIYLLAGINLVLIVLTMRRTAIALPIVGLIAYYWISGFKKELIKLTIIISTLGALLYPFYGDILQKRISVRAEAGRFQIDFYESESRFQEIIRVSNTALGFTELTQSLFGKDVLYGYYDNGYVSRFNHTDYGQVLSSTGLIGTCIYALIYIKIFLNLLKMKKNSEFSPYHRALYSLICSLIFMSLFAGLNGSILIVTFRFVTFFSIGLLIGELSWNSKKHKLTISQLGMKLT